MEMYDYRLIVLEESREGGKGARRSGREGREGLISNGVEGERGRGWETSIGATVEASFSQKSWVCGLNIATALVPTRMDDAGMQGSDNGAVQPCGLGRCRRERGHAGVV